MQKLSVRDLEVKGRRVLPRIDFNVPTVKTDGKVRITDDTLLEGKELSGVAALTDR